MLPFINYNLYRNYYQAKCFLRYKNTLSLLLYRSVMKCRIQTQCELSRKHIVSCLSYLCVKYIVTACSMSQSQTDTSKSRNLSQRHSAFNCSFSAEENAYSCTLICVNKENCL